MLPGHKERAGGPKLRQSTRYVLVRQPETWVGTPRNTQPHMLRLFPKIKITYTAHIVMDVRQTKNTALCWSYRANKPLNSCWKAVNFRSKIHLSVRTFKRGNKYI